MDTEKTNWPAMPSSPPLAPSATPPTPPGPSASTPLQPPPYRPPVPAAPATGSVLTRPLPAPLARAAMIGMACGVLVALVVLAGVSLSREGGGPQRNAATAGPAPARIEAGTVQGVLEEVSPSVVSIYTTSAQGTGTGSGFVYSADGLVVTNAHVVDGAERVEVDLASGESSTATIIESVPGADIAVLRLDDPPAGLVPATLGSSSDLEIGEEVIAIGNALNLGSTPSVTTGIVSGLGRAIPTEDGRLLAGLIQTDAAINPGNSGGPLVDTAGRVVGINTAIIADAQSVGFALPIDQSAAIVAQVAAGKAPRVPTAVLGVKVVAAGTDQGRSGALVESVTPDSGAAAAGIAAGDVIVAIDGRRVRSGEDVARLVRAKAPGQQVVVRLERDGAQVDLEVTTGDGG